MLYELREADFFKINYMDDRDAMTGDRDSTLEEGDLHPDERFRWEKTTNAFTLLKAKIATTPILKHIDPDRVLVIVVYASK